MFPFLENIQNNIELWAENTIINFKSWKAFQSLVSIWLKTQNIWDKTLHRFTNFSTELLLTGKILVEYVWCTVQVSGKVWKIRLFPTEFRLRVKIFGALPQLFCKLSNFFFRYSVITLMMMIFIMLVIECRKNSHSFENSFYYLRYTCCCDYLTRLQILLFFSDSTILHANLTL